MRPSESSKDPSPRQVRLCSFWVGQQSYVVDIMRIQEIVNPLPVTALPGLAGRIEGVIDLRGTLVPLIDLRKVFGLPAGEPSPAAKQMILRLDSKLVAFRTDAMGRVIEIGRDEIRETEAIDDETRRRFPGAIKYAGQLHLLLDLRSIVDELNTGEEGMGS